MNNKGFAITGVLYSVLLIFLVMIVTLLFNLQNRKTILDELKADTVNAVESENNYEYLLEEINKLKNEVNTINSGKQWKELNLNDGGKTQTTLPTSADEYYVNVMVTDGTYYYFHSLHLVDVRTSFSVFRLFDGTSEARVLLDYGKISLTGAKIDDTDVYSTSKISVYYR